MRHRACVSGLGFVTTVAVLMLGCARPSEDRAAADVEAALDPANPGGEVEAMSRAQFVDWADNFSYQAPDSSRGYAYGFSDSVQVEVLSRLPDSGRFRGHLTGRLIAQRAYASLGIGAGRNYVWVDSGASGYATTIYAEDPAVAAVTHATSVHEPPPAVQPDTAIGFCLRCGDVRRPRWCGVAYDVMPR